MLHRKAVNTELLELLNELMTHEMFNNFLLVGGTGLALQIGHRHSIDLDLFGKSELDEYEFTAFLNNLGRVQVLKKSKNILIYSVNGIKVDFVNYSYPWLKTPLVSENIRIASREDIGAMKLNAISGRGSKKEFIDLYFLLQEYSLRDLIKFFKDKYHDGSEFLVLKSLTYFEDADQDEMPKMSKTINWEEIKSELRKKIKKYISECSR